MLAITPGLKLIYWENRKDFVKSTHLHKAVTVKGPFGGGSAPEILLHGSYLNSNRRFSVKLICAFVALQFFIFFISHVINCVTNRLLLLLLLKSYLHS